MERTRTKPTKGQFLFCLSLERRTTPDAPDSMSRVIVTKVGRVYFTCHPDSDPEGKRRGREYHNEGWGERTTFTSRTSLYADLRERAEEKEEQRIRNRLYQIFSSTSRSSKVPFHVPREIDTLLGGGNY